MSFERIDHEKYSVFKLNERWFDSKAARILNEYFIECKKHYVHRIILDLSECEMISSEGIGLLVAMWEFFQHDGKMFIVLKNEGVIDLLKECGIYTMLQKCFYNDLETARAHIQHRSPRGFYASDESSKTCPVCNGDKIEYYDKGLKRLKRLLAGKKRRRVCKDCYLVWRT